MPTFSGGNARYAQVGNIVFVRVEFFNSTGGTAGAGTGQLAASLPVTAGANTGQLLMLAGYFANSNSAGPEGIVYGTLGASATTITLKYFNAINTTTSFTLATLNNANFRQLGLHFWYEV